MDPLLDTALLSRLERLSLATHRRLAGRDKGDRRSVRMGSSVEFLDYRHYSVGDDPRQVDWNIYGRTGNLFVKLREEEEMLTTHLLVDASRSMDWGSPSKYDYALRLAAALGYIALCGHGRLVAARVGEGVAATFGPVWGRRRAWDLMAFLAAGRPGGATDLESALRAYATSTRMGGLAVLISDLLTPTYQDGLKRLLERRIEVAVVHLLAPDEVRPAMSGDLALVDRETGRRVEVTMNQEALDRYRARFDLWTREIESFCSRYGVLYQRLETSCPLEETLFQTLRRRGLLQ